MNNLILKSVLNLSSSKLSDNATVDIIAIVVVGGVVGYALKRGFDILEKREHGSISFDLSKRNFNFSF